MLGIDNYWLFVTAGVALNLAPGPDTLFIVGNSIAKGTKAGVCAVLGISTGCLVHIPAAAMGLSAILMVSSNAFAVVKYAGALYLAYLGLKAITSRSTIAKGEAAQDCRPITIYYQGFLTNLLNPKVAVFFLSFLPQFVSANNAYGPVPFVVLGLTFLTTGTLWCLLLAVFASQLTGVLRRSATIGSVLNKAVGILFLGMAANLILAKRR
jgi:threonine/homoserine/homoserine lactone efflux protein